jgi:hypothetical protein
MRLESHLMTYSTMSVSTDVPNTTVRNLGTEGLGLTFTVPATLPNVPVGNPAQAFLVEPQEHDSISDRLSLTITPIVGGTQEVSLAFFSDPRGGILGETGSLSRDFPGFTGIVETGGFDIVNGEDMAGNRVNRFQVKDPVTGAITQVPLPRDFVVAVASDISEIPEPATLLLFGTTMVGLGLTARWRRRRQN